MVAQYETDEKAADPIRVFREDGYWLVGGTVDGTEEAADLARQDAVKRGRWGRYFGVRPGRVQDQVLITIREVAGELQPYIVHDPMNPSFTDEAVMARFADPVEAA